MVYLAGSDATVMVKGKQLAFLFLYIAACWQLFNSFPRGGKEKRGMFAVENHF